MELPDFEDMALSIDKITALALQKSQLEIKIKDMESNVFKIILTDPAYLQQGKPPSITYIENTYKFTGITNEIMPYREQLANVCSELERERLSFDMMKDQIEIWRSEQATQRISLNLV